MNPPKNPRRRGRPVLTAAMLGLCLMASIWPATLRADDEFFGNDERVVVKPLDLPWQAIGKIIHRNGGYCTGTLIAPDVVLTAAHCLFDDVSDDDAEEHEFVWDAPVYFLAGFHEGRFAAVAHVADSWYPPKFEIEVFADTYDVDNLDFALLRLQEPIGNQVGWFDVAPIDGDTQKSLLGPGGKKVNQAGYSADSKNRMTAHIGCRLLSFEPNDTLLHQCDTMEGDSGSPLFVQQDGRYRIVALESQSLRLDDELVNSAVDARAFFDAVQAYFSN